MPSLVSSELSAPVEVTIRASRALLLSPGRLSSFGFGGTIAHGAFEPGVTLDLGAAHIERSGGPSCYRASLVFLEDLLGRSLEMATELGGGGSGSGRGVKSSVSSWCLSNKATSVMFGHTIAGRVLVPGVSYAEMACAASQEASCMFRHLNFIRPCAIPGCLASNGSLALRCVQLEAGGFNIESREVRESPSWYEAEFVTNATGRRVGSAM